VLELARTRHRVAGLRGSLRSHLSHRRRGFGVRRGRHRWL